MLTVLVSVVFLMDFWQIPQLNTYILFFFQIRGKVLFMGWTKFRIDLCTRRSEVALAVLGLFSFNQLEGFSSTLNTRTSGGNKSD